MSKKSMAQPMHPASTVRRASGVNGAEPKRPDLTVASSRGRIV
jgi:hypothetical protein